MIAHNDARPGSLDIVAIDVEASGIAVRPLPRPGGAAVLDGA